MEASSRSAAEFFGLFDGRKRVVGTPLGARRMTRTELRNILKKYPGAESFSVFARKFACYRAARGSRGLKPGSGPGYGAEFVFVGSSSVTHVIVVDPRSTEASKLKIGLFLKRGAEYWMREYPSGWATSAVWLPMPPDCRKAIYSRMLMQTSQTYSALMGALRRYLEPSATFNASMSPGGFFALLALLGGPTFNVEGSEASAPLFEVVETQRCRKLIAWDNGVQPPGRIESGKVVCSIDLAIKVATREIKAKIVTWASSIKHDTLIKANKQTNADVEQALRKVQKRKASGVDGAFPSMPKCVTMCLYPEHKMYAKNAVRYPTLAVVRGFCNAVGAAPQDVVDIDRMVTQWSAGGSKSGLAELRHGLERGKAYPVTCSTLDNAGGCPFKGNVTLCCAQLNKPLPPLTDLRPATIWAMGHPKKHRV